MRDCQDDNITAYCKHISAEWNLLVGTSDRHLILNGISCFMTVQEVNKV